MALSQGRMDERPSVIVIAQLINPRAFFGEDKISCSVDVKKKKKNQLQIVLSSLSDQAEKPLYQ